jgi:hypothetical protein
MSPPVERPAEEPEAEEPRTIESLVHAGDVDALLELAKSYRASRDLKACLACYEAAAGLGSAEAEHAVGLFCLAGGVVAKDEKKAAGLFRSAADKGHLPAKVYVANLYELGINYKQDKEKADVWYRNVARAAKIEHDPSSFEYALEMAELGCVRQCLAVLENPDTNDEERLYFTRKAKAYGWREKGRETAPPPEPVVQEPPTLAVAEEKKEPEEKKKPDTKKAKGPKGEPIAKAGLVAFLWASLLVAAAVGAGYLGLEGVRLLVAKYGPVLGAHEERIVLGVAAALAFGGALMVYTFKSAVQALLVAGLFAGVGYVAWRAPHTHLFHLQIGQAIAFGIAGFLAALFVLGLFGGAKKRSLTRPTSSS